MPSSGSYDFSVNRNDIINLANEMAGVKGIGRVLSAEDIDRIGIGPANHEAIRRAVLNLHATIDHIFIDAFAVAGLPAPVSNIIHGDATVYSIAAASIVAKVERDHLMGQLHEQYPEYGFREHKGYGTERHQRAIEQYGLCAIHRRSYKPISQKKLV